MRNWAAQSKIYLIFTSYKLVRNGEMCRGQSVQIILTFNTFYEKPENFFSGGGGTNIIKVIEYFYWKPQVVVLHDNNFHE